MKKQKTNKIEREELFVVEDKNNYTDEDSIKYVGHSNGCRVALSSLAKYQETGKILMVAIFLLFTFSFASAMTIQELVDSYSFDYFGEEIDILNITDSIGGDYLHFNLTAVNMVVGDYVFYIDLDDVWGIVSGKKSQSFSSSEGEVNINISTLLLSGKTQFNYTIRIYDENHSLIYREGNLTTEVYSSYDSGYKILNVVDSNVNNDYIRLNVSLNSSVASTENVSVFLEYDDEFISATNEESLSIGINYVVLNIDNETIKSTHYEGNYNITGVLVGKKRISLNLTTSNYDYENFAKTSYFKDYNSSFIDLDDNNLTDYIEFNFTINAKSSDNYLIEAEIYDLYGNYLSKISKNQSLNIGDNSVLINLNGTLIYPFGLGVPYKISIARLILEEDLTDLVFDSHTTNTASFYGFEKPPLPDLNIKMTSSFNGVNNLVNISVENIGEAPAFNVLVDLFDGEEYEKQFIQDVINESSVYSFELVVNESFGKNVLIGVVDFDNLIDEENESNNVDRVEIVKPFFTVKNSTNHFVAWFEGDGNLSLKGSCSVSSNCVAPNNSFILRNSTGDTVSYIGPLGNLCIEEGDCSDLSASCNPSEYAFIIRNSGTNMSYIDFSGNLCLTGRLNENVFG